MLRIARFQAGVAKWQTHQTQNLAVATPCGFDSHLRHPLKSVFLPMFTGRFASFPVLFCLKVSCPVLSVVYQVRQP